MLMLELAALVYIAATVGPFLLFFIILFIIIMSR